MPEGHQNKTRQDQQSPSHRQRVKDAQHLVEWMRKHKPKSSADWQAYRRG